MKKYLLLIVKSIGISITIILVINFLYMKNEKNFGTMDIYKNDNAYLKNIPNNIEICDFGNSEAYYALDYSVVNDKYVCYNFALPAQTISYNLNILDQYKDKIKENATIFICLSYDSFYSTDEEEDIVSFLSKNKRYYKFLDRDHIKNYDLYNYLIIKYLPSLAETSIKDLLIQVIGMNKENNEWDNKTSKEDSISHGIQKYKTTIKENVINGKRIINKKEVLALYEMIDICRSINARPILIITPYLEEYLNAIEENDESFFEDYNDCLNSIINDLNIEVFRYDLDSSFYNKYELFINTDHMNCDGAKQFTKKLFKDSKIEY